MKCNIKKTDEQERFTQLPNKVLEWLYGPESNLSSREKDIMMMVFRYTYGFHRNSHVFTSRFVSAGTGIDKSDVNKAFKRLGERGFLLVEIRGHARRVTLCKRKYKNRKKTVNAIDSEYIEGDSPSTHEEEYNRGCFTPDTEGDLPTKKERRTKRDLGWVDADQDVFDEHLGIDQSFSLLEEENLQTLEELQQWAASQPVESMSPEEHKKMYQAFLKVSGLGSVELEHNGWYGGRSEDRNSHFDEDRRKYGPWDDEIF